MFKLSSNAKEIERRLNAIARKQVPYATSLALNNTAKDVIKAEQDEMRRVFDRPTPFILRGLRVTKYAKKTDLQAEVGFKDVYGRSGEAVENTLKPHIPGFPATRQPKGMERQLRRRGFLGANEWLVPSRTLKLNQYGNITGPLATKMLADIGAYKGISGFDGTTKGRKAQYIWGEVKARSGGTVKGIWKVEGGRDNYARGGWSLQMVVVKQPHYRKRFDWSGTARETFDKCYPARFDAAMDQAIATAR